MLETRSDQLGMLVEPLGMESASIPVCTSGRLLHVVPTVKYPIKRSWFCLGSTAGAVIVGSTCSRPLTNPYEVVTANKKYSRIAVDGDCNGVGNIEDA
jgi:hypothetical protein